MIDSESRIALATDTVPNSLRKNLFEEKDGIFWHSQQIGNFT
jgi:hypothetical protein